MKAALVLFREIQIARVAAGLKPMRLYPLRRPRVRVSRGGTK
jgi:hypothetical protein